MCSSYVYVRHLIFPHSINLDDFLISSVQYNIMKYSCIVHVLDCVFFYIWELELRIMCSQLATIMFLHGVVHSARLSEPLMLKLCQKP